MKKTILPYNFTHKLFCFGFVCTNRELDSDYSTEIPLESRQRIPDNIEM